MLRPACPVFSLLTPDSLYQTISDTESLLELHSFHMEDLEDEIALLISQLEGPGEAYSYAFLLKDKGNSLFKAKNFQAALDCYKNAIILLTLSVPMMSERSNVCESLPGCSQLVVSLHLNLAFCELKLDHYETAIHLCSLVLRIEMNNVKALFRRGCAYVNLGEIVKASMDFKKASLLDPNNKEIQIEVSKSETISFPDGLGSGLKKKGETPDDGMASSSKNLSFLEYQQSLNNGFNKSSVSLGLGERKVSVENQSNIFPANSRFRVGEEKLMCKSSTSVSREFQAGKLKLDVNQNASHKSLSDSMETVFNQNLPPNVVDQELVPSMTFDKNCQSPKQFSKKVPPIGKVVFINKKRPCSSLHLSREDVDRLRNGKELCFFNSRSMTTMKVKTFKKENLIPSQMDVSMEVHQNQKVRVAETSECEDILSSSNLVDNLKDGITLSKDETGSISQVYQNDLPITGKLDEEVPMEDLRFGSAFSSLNPLYAKITILRQKCEKKSKSSGSRAALKAKKRALRVAKYKATFINGQKQGQHRGANSQVSSNHEHSNNFNNLTIFRKVGFKCNPPPLQEDDSQLKKKICNGSRFNKSDVEHKGNLYSILLSPLHVEETNSYRPKLAHSDVVQAK